MKLNHIKQLVNHIVPRHSIYHTYLKNWLSYVGLAKPSLYTNKQYRRWITDSESKYVSKPVKEQDYGAPLVSLVIPFFNTPDRYLGELMASLNSQTYRNWELIMVDASDDSSRSNALRAWAETDQRYMYVQLTKNYHIADNTNKGIKHARGIYIAFADHDDLLSPNAMNEIAKVFAEYDPDIMYSDEDKLSEDGKIRHSPYFKPDWSPHLFMMTNYTNHLSVIKRELIVKSGLLDAAFNGSQDYDLLLRIHAANKGLRVHHIDKILYHWREANNSTASGHTKKSYAHDAGRRALQRYLDVKDISAEAATINDFPGYYRIVFQSQPRDLRVNISVRVEGEDSTSAMAYVERLKSVTNTKMKVSYDVVGNQLHEKSDVEVVIKKHALPSDDRWLDQLAAVALLDEVRVVSPRILNKEGRVFYAGSVKNKYLPWLASFSNLAKDDHTPSGAAWWVRDSDDEPLDIVVNASKNSIEGSGKYNVVWSFVDFTLE